MELFLNRKRVTQSTWSTKLVLDTYAKCVLIAYIVAPSRQFQLSFDYLVCMFSCGIGCHASTKDHCSSAVSQQHQPLLLSRGKIHPSTARAATTTRNLKVAGRRPGLRHLELLACRPVLGLTRPTGLYPCGTSSNNRTTLRSGTSSPRRMFQASIPEGSHFQLKTVETCYATCSTAFYPGVHV